MKGIFYIYLLSLSYLLANSQYEDEYIKSIFLKAEKKRVLEEKIENSNDSKQLYELYMVNFYESQERIYYKEYLSEKLLSKISDKEIFFQILSHLLDPQSFEDVTFFSCSILTILKKIQDPSFIEKIFNSIENTIYKKDLINCIIGKTQNKNFIKKAFDHAINQSKLYMLRKIFQKKINEEFTLSDHEIFNTYLDLISRVDDESDIIATYLYMQAVLYRPTLKDLIDDIVGVNILVNENMGLDAEQILIESKNIKDIFLSIQEDNFYKKNMPKTYTEAEEEFQKLLSELKCCIETSSLDEKKVETVLLGIEMLNAENQDVRRYPFTFAKEYNSYVLDNNTFLQVLVLLIKLAQTKKEEVENNLIYNYFLEIYSKSNHWTDLTNNLAIKNVFEENNISICTTLEETLNRLEKPEIILPTTIKSNWASFKGVHSFIVKKKNEVFESFQPVLEFFFMMQRGNNKNFTDYNQVNKPRCPLGAFYDCLNTINFLMQGPENLIHHMEKCE